MTAEQKVTRKLRAIMSADVKGYSILMADDEVATVQTLKDYRNIMSARIKQHDGRVVDAVGDNLLAEFDSAVDAIQCAVEVQKELKVKNQDLPEGKRLEFRIGVNIGDVIQDGDSIFGDGVNIAARIEGLADAGGVCVSRNVYNHIKKKLSLGYEFLGEHPVKNISEPVTVYKVLMDEKDAGKLLGIEKKASKKGWYWAVAAAVVVAVIGLGIWQFYLRPPPIEPASEEKMAYPLPDKPSIAVLPFDNLSGDQSQEYVADGISEGIISSLSKIPDMLVIARNSTFVYKGKAVKVNQVAEELGVKYVLEGSVQRSGENLRVTAQLVDAVKGHHLWSQKYDRSTEDFFAVQDNIARNIVVELQVKLTEGEQARIWHATENLEALENATRGIALMQLYTKDNNAKARELFKKAAELDPNYAFAWISIAWTHGIDARYGFSESRGESFKQCIEYTKKASALNDSMPEVHSTWNFIYLLQKQHDKAIAEGKKAVALAPSDATSHMLLSLTLHFAGRFDESIFHIKEAMRLDPYYPASHLFILGNSYCMAKEYEKAITVLEKAIERTKVERGQRANNHTRFIQTLVESGQIERARDEASEVLKLEPNFSLKDWQKSLFYKNPEDLDRHLSALREAGLPDEPPLPLPDKPSIAVLAFDNLSGDPEQEYFSDGIAENIITALSKIGELFVIARNSSFTYKGKPVKVQQIGRELGVRYVMEGSVQKSGDRARITAQLIDAKSGQHLWAENYDRDFKDIFEIQDEITMKIVTSLAIKLTEGEQVRVLGKHAQNLDEYLKVAQALSLWRKGTKEDYMRYGQVAQEIIDAYPESAFGYRLRAWYHKVLADYFVSPRENIKKAFELAQKAVSIDASDGFSYSLLGHLYMLMREYDKAIQFGKLSVELQPNGTIVNLNLGMSLNYAGQINEAMAYIKQAIRLNPFPAFYYYLHLGFCYRQKGQYEEALTEFKKALQLAPDSSTPHAVLATTYSLLGREEEARASTTKAL